MMKVGDLVKSRLGIVGIIVDEFETDTLVEFEHHAEWLPTTGITIVWNTDPKWEDTWIEKDWWKLEVINGN